MDIVAVVVAGVNRCGGGGGQNVSTRFMDVQSFLLSVISKLIALKVSARDLDAGVEVPVFAVVILDDLVLVVVQIVSDDGS